PKKDFDINYGVVANWRGTSQGYNYKSSALMTSTAQIDAAINSFQTIGGTPTVPAIDDTIAAYNAIKGDTTINNRKTVFLLISDGVANGYRKTAGGP
ncbi:hypothetical protein, partial [Enterococcus faecium]|uniref:hypothetical protein n=1 Tax=Enterococcus faecium TaxID=1352 RepID=UPI0034E98C2E